MVVKGLKDTRFIGAAHTEQPPRLLKMNYRFKVRNEYVKKKYIYFYLLCARTTPLPEFGLLYKYVENAPTRITPYG